MLADFSNAPLRTKSLKEELQAEFARKGIHLLIAVVPGLASLNLPNTALLLMVGILFYTVAESMRFLGFPMPMISPVTEAVLRRREQGRFALAPVTLGLGALLTLLLLPAPVAAAAIYALAFGDSASSLVGKFLGRMRPAFLKGKSLEGSLACIVTSFLAAFFVFREWKTALAVGIASLLIDALPLREFDNLFLPLAAGFAALIFQV
ncbi:MAG: phosphatidate cytidylyltransferase [Treponema sp.]|nr:phosphatidate cytidylyltransferase [Treponema sp.]